ncbi:LLM class flavin-dependent oxidoreductase [Streptomyces sp. NPDC014636]|uniref:LLM class flavin-dependent oxidoreductase n=1 Tax=Streptomyces sp. NPDC014636 TaxID=3364876 RepID=UPI0036F7029F
MTRSSPVRCAAGYLGETGEGQFMETSVIFPVMPTDPSDAVPFVELVRNENMPRLWHGQSITTETHQMFAYLAGMGFRIPFGTAVTLMPLRHPMETATHARSLARLTGRRVTLGLGPGSPDFVASLRGKPYDSPKAVCADYLRQVRGFLTEQRHEAPESCRPASDLSPLRRAGLRVHPSQPYLNARALVDSETFVYGTPQEVTGALAEYARAGVDEVVLNSAGVGLAHGWNAALEDLAELSAEMRAARSGVIT